MVVVFVITALGRRLLLDQRMGTREQLGRDPQLANHRRRARRDFARGRRRRRTLDGDRVSARRQESGRHQHPHHRLNSAKAAAGRGEIDGPAAFNPLQENCVARGDSAKMTMTISSENVHDRPRLRIFLAGATGVIGIRLLPLLIAEHHTVAGMTRSPEKIDQLRALGAEPIICDVFDSVLLTLMERFVKGCNAECPRLGRAFLSVGGRRAGLVRDARSDSYTRVHGLATVSAGPVFVVRARLSKDRAWAASGLLTVRSRMLSRVCQVPPLLDRRGVGRGAGVSRRGRAPSRTRRVRGRRRPRRSCGACRAPRRAGARRCVGGVAPARRSRPRSRLGRLGGVAA